MSAEIVIDDVIRRLARRYGSAKLHGRARIITFGSSLTCSINYSKLLRGGKYFFGLPSQVLDTSKDTPETRHGTLVLLICGSADKILAIPRDFMVRMMEGVVSRRVDVFLEDNSYILQTTRHPKCDVSQYLNAFPPDEPLASEQPPDRLLGDSPRTHLKIQLSLIMLGKAEGCAVWVPTNDRNLSYHGHDLSKHTIGKLPNFGFDENTRRIVQNIDVLWLSRNIILKALEIEATTSIYSGLLRLNDLALAQPNTTIDLYLAAPAAKRMRVCSQLLRPSFQALLPKCSFLSFEHIEEQARRLESLSVEGGMRVTGLLRGEKFSAPEHFLYPTDV